MTDFIAQITADFQKQIDAFEGKPEQSEVGFVLEAGDGIARVNGLGNVSSQELVQFANGVIGIAFNLEKESVGERALSVPSIEQNAGLSSVGGVKRDAG